MTVKTYDEKSYDLAEHFLSDHPTLNTLDKIHHLALAIQAAVEDWIEYEEVLEIRAQTQSSDLYSPTIKRVMKKFDEALDLHRKRR